MSWHARTFLIALVVLLLLPFAMAVAVSFGGEAKIKFPPDSYSLRWYGELFVDQKWRASMGRSLLIALFAALLSVSLALPICYHLWRRQSWFSRGLFGLSLSPFLLPLAALIISRGFAGLSQEVIEASRTLGADNRSVFTSVVLPLIFPFVMTGFVLVFIVSLNEYLIAFQVAGVSVETFPIRIFNDATRSGHSPILTAGAVLFAGFTVVFLIVLSFFTDILKLFGSENS